MARDLERDERSPLAAISPEKLGLIIPTLNAGRYLDRMLAALDVQTLKPAHFLVMDSSSDDDTAARFRAAGAEVEVIPRSEFDHGGTRQRAVEMLPDAVEVLIFLTQDAIPARPDTFANLVAAFRDPRAGMAYGRQLPSPGASPIAAHARLYNYPAESHVRTAQDASHYGIKAAFCSNSFAAYRRAALRQAGGFPRRVIVSEETLAAAAIVAAGWSKYYVAEACVYHSHEYSLTQEFRRYFDIGVLHGSAPALLERFGRPEGEGARFVRSELAFLRRRAPLMMPLALARTATKYLGYRFGLMYRHLPLALAQRFSMHPAYWFRPDGS